MNDTCPNGVPMPCTCTWHPPRPAPASGECCKHPEAAHHYSVLDEQAWCDECPAADYAWMHRFSPVAPSAPERGAERMGDERFAALAEIIMAGEGLPSGHEDMVREARRAREAEAALRERETGTNCGPLRPCQQEIAALRAQNERLVNRNEWLSQMQGNADRRANRAEAEAKRLREALTKLLSDKDAIECQECGIGHSRAWKKAAAALKEPAP